MLAVPLKALLAAWKHLAFRCRILCCLLTSFCSENNLVQASMHSAWCQSHAYCWELGTDEVPAATTTIPCLQGIPAVARRICSHCPQNSTSSEESKTSSLWPARPTCKRSSESGKNHPERIEQRSHWLLLCGSQRPKQRLPGANVIILSNWAQ